MATTHPITFLCLASYEKGQEFMREAKRQGCRVFLLTTQALEGADWPHESLDEKFYLPDMYNRQDVIHAISYLARHEVIDRIVALDDFDVETAAMLREHLRVPGMGDTTARYFRDKLAMRVKALEHGILVPPFVHALNYDRLNEYMATVPAPWVLKPRSEASAVGIKKINAAEELWPALDQLGDRQSFYVLEKYVAGDVFHIDSIVVESEILFAEVHKYSAPPLDIVSAGGLFCTRTLPRGDADEAELKRLNRELLTALGLVRGVTHTEFIKGRDDGQFYFLETAARVGGANIAEMVEAATGLNLWREWARLEVAAAQRVPYELPPHREDHAGVLISLSRQEWPDTSAYQEPEIVWRLNKKSHVGLIFASPDVQRVQTLLDQTMQRFRDDFLAIMPAPDKPTS